jgi:LPXTG-motif cell wall-anchored protein
VSDTRLLRPLRLLAAGLVAVVSLALLGSVAAAQEAQTDDPYGGPPPTVGSTTTVPVDQTTQPTVLAETETRGLAVTGGDVVGLLAIGGGAVAVGGALVLAAKRRRSLELA